MDKTKGRINMSDLIVRPRMLNLKGLMPVRVWVLFFGKIKRPIKRLV